MAALKKEWEPRHKINRHTNTDDGVDDEDNDEHGRSNNQIKHNVPIWLTLTHQQDHICRH